MLNVHNVALLHCGILYTGSGMNTYKCVYIELKHSTNPPKGFDAGSETTGGTTDM